MVAVGIESDASSAQTYRSNFPLAEVIEKDLRSVEKGEVLKVLDRKFPNRTKTVLISGPPCQPFSNANMHTHNKGGDHPCFDGIELFAKVMKEISPDAFLFENVVTFETMDNGKSMARLLKTLNRLGFHPSLAKLHAHHYQVPQRRRRLFVGSFREANGFELPSNDSPWKKENGQSKNNGDLVHVRDTISDLPRLPVGGGGREETAYPENSERELSRYQRKARSSATKLANHWSTRHSDEVVDTIRLIKPGLSLVRAWRHLPRWVRNRYTNGENLQENIYRRLRWQDLSPTIVHPRRAMLLHPQANRILSVREAARLQGFPDRFRFHGGIDSQYQQVANAVPPPMARFLGKLYNRRFSR